MPSTTSPDIEEEVTRSVKEMSVNGNGGDDAFEFCFGNLPERALQEIFGYLSIWSLMDLRLVSKDARSAVDAQALERFVLHVKNDRHLGEEDFRKSTTTWKNIILHTNFMSVDLAWVRNPLYQELLARTSKHLRILNLDEHRVPYVGLRSILSSCPNLKRIEIHGLACAEWTDAELEKEEFITAMKTAETLEELSISYLAWERDNDLDLFKSVLKHCRSLKYLKVPHVLYANFMFGSEEDEEAAEQHHQNLITTKVVGPVLDLINSPQQEEQRITKYLDVENLHHTEVFPSLAQACFNNGWMLVSLEEDGEEPVSPNEMQLVTRIESLTGFTQNLAFDHLSNLKVVKLSSENSQIADIAPEYVHCDLPKLESISFCLSTEANENFLKFLKTPRPSVKSFSVEFQIDDVSKLAEVFPAKIICENYKNLKHLNLKHWNGTDDDLISILESVTSLTSLRLQNCQKITDIGFLGHTPSQPALLNLKYLKDVWIDCQITDAVLKCAVRHLSLESFFYSSEWVTVPGFLSLTKGPLVTSLVCFPVLPPSNCSDEVLLKFLSFFKNLKRGPVSSLKEFNVDVHQ